MGRLRQEVCDLVTRWLTGKGSGHSHRDMETSLAGGTSASSPRPLLTAQPLVKSKAYKLLRTQILTKSSSCPALNLCANAQHFPFISRVSIPLIQNLKYAAILVVL